MKELESLNAEFVIDTFLLLLIGIGPKIALVPFLETTGQMPEATKRRVLRKMLTTAATVAVLLLILGGLLTRLLHFSPGALGVASGIILLIIAVTMVLGPRDGDSGSHPAEDQDPMRVAVCPLAVPYLLNPAGIVVLVTGLGRSRFGLGGRRLRRRPHRDTRPRHRSVPLGRAGQQPPGPQPDAGNREGLRVPPRRPRRATGAQRIV